MAKYNKEEIKYIELLGINHFKAKYGAMADTYLKFVSLPHSNDVVVKPKIPTHWEMDEEWEDAWLDTKRKELLALQDEFINACKVVIKPNLEGEKKPNYEHISDFLTVVNEYVFEEEQSEYDVNMWLTSHKQSEQVEVKNIKWFTVLLDAMKQQDFLCHNYKDIIENRKMFCSKHKTTLTANILSSKLSELSARYVGRNKGKALRKNEKEIFVKIQNVVSELAK